MASERQISANRRNAQKSIGPRTDAGKRRASQNAHRHGLASRAIINVDTTQQIEELTRTLSGDSNFWSTREWARTATESIVDLDRVRQVKLSLLNRIMEEQTEAVQESQRSEVDILPALSELQALERYERRFSSRRDRAIRKLMR